MTDTDMNNLSLYLEKNYGLTSDRVIAKAIDIVANDNSFHPIIDLLESLKWDGRPRISGMLTHFFGAENPEYAGEVMKIHMLAAIYFEYSYNLVHLLQSKDRIHRLGLPDGQYTQYYFLEEQYVTNDGEPFSLDEKIYDRLREKEQIMLDAIENNVLEKYNIIL